MSIEYYLKTHGSGFLFWKFRVQQKCEILIVGNCMKKKLPAYYNYFQSTLSISALNVLQL